MKRLNVWITMLTASYVSMVVGKLVRQGYTVGPLDPEMPVLGTKDNPAAVLAIFLDHADDKGNNEVLNDIEEVLARLKVKYHSIVISEAGASCCVGSNISLKELQENKPKRVQRSYLRLVPQPKKEEEKQPEPLS